MLYLIKDNYYMLRNREYVRVDVELKEGQLIIKPDRRYVIENNDNVHVKGIMIDDIVKELQKKIKSTTYDRKYDR